MWGKIDRIALALFLCFAAVWIIKNGASTEPPSLAGVDAEAFAPAADSSKPMPGGWALETAKLGTTPRQGALSLAMREIGRIERTIHTLDWIEDKGLRAETNDVLNKGEARHTLARAVAFHRLGRFRDRSHERQSHRAAALNLVTACIGLFNCRYLDRAVGDLRRHGVSIDDQHLRRLSPFGWDHINLTGDYVWSDNPPFDVDGMRPLNSEAEHLAA
jgi:Tn3 transposase DDE domain